MSQPDGRHRHPDQKPSTLWSRIAALVVVVALGLLAAVVIVGLKNNSLDVTGVATVLGTLISAVVVGVIVKGTGGDR